MRTAMLVVLSVGLSGVAVATPQAYPPALALYHTDNADNPGNIVQVSITGTGFGAAHAGTFAAADCGTATGGSFVIVSSGSTAIVTARSTDTSQVSAWTDGQIVLTLDATSGAADALSVQVCTPAGQSPAATVAKWVYEHVDVPTTPSTNALPLSMTRDAGGNVWVNEEFHREVKLLTNTQDILSSVWNPLSIPQLTPPGYFALTVNGDHRSPISELGEDIIVDPLNRIWLSEGGKTPYKGLNPNHGRIVMYDPGAQVIRTLNVPGDNNGIFGLSWDAARGRIWFTEARRSRRTNPFAPEVLLYRARLTSFDPICVGNPACPNPPNYGIANWLGTFDFDGNAAKFTCVGGSPTSPISVGTCQKGSQPINRKCFSPQDCVLANQRCQPGVPDYWCFHEYEIPDTAGPTGSVGIPAHVLAHADGTVWYSGYSGGNHIGRLDPATSTFQQYPLGAPADQATCDYGSCFCFSNSQPACPDRCCQYLLFGQAPWSLVQEPSGTIALSFQFQAAVGRFDVSRVNDPACLTLDATGQNPCVSYDFVPTFDFDTQFPHSAQIDAAGNIWLSIAGPKTDCAALTSIGYRQVSTGHVLMFPPLGFYPQMAGGTCTAFSGGGLAYDPSTTGMWFTDYWRKRLGRVRPQ